MTPALCVLLLLYPIVATGVVRQMLDQRDKDKSRLPYIATFPNDLSTTNIEEWMWSISGRTQKSSRISGVHTLAFEVWATKEGIVHRLKVPWQQAQSVIPQLQGLIPGIKVTRDYEPPRHTWT